jgi:hypothetical protein
MAAIRKVICDCRFYTPNNTTSIITNGSINTRTNATYVIAGRCVRPDTVCCSEQLWQNQYTCMS